MTIAMQIINPLFGSGFIPTDILSLILWLDANDPATLFQDSALTTPAVLDGDPIGGWVDKSGNSNAAVQAVGAKRPTFRTAVFLGKPIARIDGVDDFMNFITPINVLPGTGFIVMKEPSGRTSLSSILSGQGGSGFELLTTRKIRLINVGLNVTSSPIITSIPNVVSFDITTTTANVYYNNVNIGFASNTNPSLLFSVLGTRNLAFFSGDIAEILLYNSLLSPTQRNDVTQYLMTKWGI